MIIASYCEACQVLGGHADGCPRDETCRLDKVTVDGKPVTVQVRGTEPLTDSERALVADLVRAVLRQYPADDPESGDG